MIGKSLWNHYSKAIYRDKRMEGKAKCYWNIVKVVENSQWNINIAFEGNNSESRYTEFEAWELY